MSGRSTPTTCAAAAASQSPSVTRPSAAMSVASSDWTFNAVHVVHASAKDTDRATIEALVAAYNAKYGANVTLKEDSS